MNFGEMAELADALRSKRSAARHVGSHPTLATRVRANGGIGRRTALRRRQPKWLCRIEACFAHHIARVVELADTLS